MSLAFQKMLRVIWLQIKDFVLSKKKLEIKLKKNEFLLAFLLTSIKNKGGRGQSVFMLSVGNMGKMLSMF